MTATAFQDVVRELSPSLRSYLERMVGDPTTAEDLLQESLIKISNALATFEGKSSLKTWAYTITTRVAIDYFRRPDQRRNMVELDEAHELWDPQADISGTSLATAKARIHRGRKRLERALERACTFYTDDEIIRCDRKSPAEDFS